MSNSCCEEDQACCSPPSDTAAAILQNPGTLAALQAGLNRIIGQQSGYIQSLPKPVKRRIKALKNIQVECAKVEGLFYEKVHALECEFAEKFKPLFDKRRNIVNGTVEPTDEECQWVSDDDDADDKEEKGESDGAELSSELKEKVSIEDEEKVETTDLPDDAKGIPEFWLTALKNVDTLADMIQLKKSLFSGQSELKEKVSIEDEEKVETTDLPDDAKGIPEFWLTALKNVDTLADMIQEHDEPILKHLQDIRVVFTGPDSMVDTTQYPQPTPMGFVLEYHFSPNPFFTNNVLTKSYKMKCEPDEDDPFAFEGPEIVSASGLICLISVPDDEADLDEETEALLAADFEIGHFFRERIVPKAVLYFTGEALEDDFEEEEEEGDEAEEGDGDEDDDDDPDYQPPPDGEKPQECKNQ
ncbi:PREDICTED: nucleosome assembly protein 1-like 1 [Acropora digitifera]|uniref:nucleosome assembly protein 1-like 1 n=1 Tax=Acropora digitifera TaxID=70779 RepID=UPI00077A8E6C|nr:PREDICTED: nucleosome assembly protein 1-like 1 [Acropora digitifera]